MKPYLRRVQYYETDQMGITHHSNYIRWMEEARIAFLEEIGWGYRKLEQEGILSPVLAVDCRYKETTGFFDVVEIAVRVKEFKGVRLVLEYEIRKQENGHIVLSGTTEHCFLDREMKPVRLKKVKPEFCLTLEKMAEFSA